MGDEAKKAPETNNQISTTPQSNNENDVYKGLLEAAKQPDELVLQQALVDQLKKTDPNITLNDPRINELSGKIRDITERWKKEGIDDATIEKETKGRFLILKEAFERKKNGTGEPERITLKGTFDPEAFKKAQEAEQKDIFRDHRNEEKEQYANMTWFDGITGSTALAGFAGVVGVISAAASMQAGNPESSIMIGSGAFLAFNYIKNQMNPYTSFEKKEVDKLAGKHGVSSEFIQNTLLAPENIAFYEGLFGKETKPSQASKEGKYGNTIEMVDQLKGLNREFMNAIDFNSFQDRLRKTPEWNSHMGNAAKKAWVESFLGQRPESLSLITKMNNPETQMIFEKNGANGNLYDVFHAMVSQFHTMKIWDQYRANAFLNVGEEGEKRRNPDAVRKLMYTKFLDSNRDK